MNQMILQGKWRQARGRARENWGRLTHNETHRYGGKADRFIGSIEEQFGHTRHRAEHDLKNFLTSYSIPGAVRLMPKSKRSQNVLMQRPWLILAIVSVLIMLVRILANGQSEQTTDHQRQTTGAGPNSY